MLKKEETQETKDINKDENDPDKNVLSWNPVDINDDPKASKIMEQLNTLTNEQF